MDTINIRKGVASDVPPVRRLIQELASYEKALDKVEITEEQLLTDGFGKEPLFEFLVAVDQTKVVGLSLFYHRYSTWKGKSMYLEDLIVTESHRSQGIGKSLLIETAKLAHESKCTGLYWQVLDWNTPAIEFYKSIGTQFDNEWVNCKLDQQSLKQFN